MPDIKLSIEFLAGLLGKTAPEVSTALTVEDDQLKSQADIETFLKTEFTGKLQAAKSAGKTEGKGWGERETRESQRTELAQILGVEVGEVPAMIQAYKSKILDGVKSNELTKEKIEESDFFKTAIETERNKYQALNDSFDKFKTEQRTKDVRKALRASTLAILKKKGFKLPEDETLLDDRIELLMSHMEGKAKFKLDEDGSPIPMNEKGERLQDEYFNDIALTDFVTKQAPVMFDVQHDDGRKSPANKTQPPGGGGGDDDKYSFPSVKNESEYFSHLSSIDDVEEMEAFKAHVDKLREAGELADA